MMLELAKVSLGVAVLTGGWLAIDLWWQRRFPGQPPRTGCHGCTCHTPCSTPGRDHETPDTFDPHDPELPHAPGEQ
jgi:hypothetical protein